MASKSTAAPAPDQTDAPAVQVPTDPNVALVQNALQGWINDVLANSPVSRSTEVWNFVQAELPDLAQRIAAALA